MSELQEAITEFACRAAEKLRRQNSHTGQVLAFIRTSPFRARSPQYSQSAVFPLPVPTSDSRTIAEAALSVLEAIYRPGFEYAKAGVMLLDLQPAGRHQFTLDLAPAGSSMSSAPSTQLTQHQGASGGQAVQRTDAEHQRLMATLDQVNSRYGRGTVLLGSAGLKGAARSWTMKQERMTPQYTTRWSDLGLVRA